MGEWIVQTSCTLEFDSFEQKILRKLIIAR